MFSLEDFRIRHDPETVEVPIHGRCYRIFTPRSILDFIDPAEPLKGFPLSPSASSPRHRAHRARGNPSASTS